MMLRVHWAVPLVLVFAADAAAAADGSDLGTQAATGASVMQGTDLNGTIGLALTESDNIYRAESDETRAAIGQAFADLIFDENTRLIQAKASSNLSFLEFQDDDYPSELLGNFYGTGRLSIAPSRFSWVLQENFGQQQITPGLPITPGNLQNINFVSTGPDFTIPVASQTDFRLTGRYSNVTYQTSDLDNNRVDGTAAIVENLSAASSLSANAGVETVRYQNSSANPDFETQEAYLDFEGRTGRTSLALMLGADRISGLKNEPTQPLFRITVDHAVSPASKLTLAAGEDYSDSGSMLRQLQELTGLSYGAAQSVTSSDPFTERYGRVAWQFEQFRTGFGVDVGRYQEIHLVETQYDQARWVADVTVRRRMTPSLTATIQGGYIDDIFNTAGYSYKTLFESVALNWQAGKRLSLALLYQHFSQTATTAIDEFGENRISIIFGYAVGRVQPSLVPATSGVMGTP